MIAIESENGELIKVLRNVRQGNFGFHEQFGFISQKRAEQRVISRRRQGYDFTRNDWHCSFHLSEEKGNLSLDHLVGCEALPVEQGWLLETPLGKFKLTQKTKACVQELLESHEDGGSWLNRLLEFLILLSFLLIPILFYLQESPVVEEEKEELVEPVTVKLIKPAQTVNVNRDVNPDIKVKPLSKAELSKRAVKRNLGFLGMLGSKDLKKVVGGVPQDLKQATAGAGAGGDAGSGGEVLTGLGKGLKKTTVGNTGLQGLGGIGTKGAGGGKGGYGNTLVASGEGSGISAISVSSSEMVLQGGISRYAINATIAKYLNQVRRCYEGQLKTKPNLQGLVEMSFEINPVGRLNFANVSRTTLKDRATENCIRGKMMSWQFPKPKGAIKVPVKYPFMLRPVGS